jgi:CHAD domain-containing protein
VKARKVSGLDPAMPFAEAAQRIIAVRSQEILDLGAKAQDPAKVKALHDLRIAAKRLRYVLELTGPEATVRQLKRLQDQLGEVHDCDVHLPEIRTLARSSPESEARGLRSVAVALACRRAECFERFHQGWPALEQELAALKSTGVAR